MYRRTYPEAEATNTAITKGRMLHVVDSRTGLTACGREVLEVRGKSGSIIEHLGLQPNGKPYRRYANCRICERHEKAIV